MVTVFVLSRYTASEGDTVPIAVSTDRRKLIAHAQRIAQDIVGDSEDLFWVRDPDGSMTLTTATEDLDDESECDQFFVHEVEELQ